MVIVDTKASVCNKKFAILGIAIALDNLSSWFDLTEAYT